MSMCSPFALSREDFNVPCELLTMDDVDFDAHRELLRKDWKDVETANLNIGEECHKLRKIITQPNNRTLEEDKLLNSQFEAFSWQNHIIQVWTKYVMGKDGHFYKILKYIELLAKEAYTMRRKNEKDLLLIKSSILEQKNLILEQEKMILRQEQIIHVMEMKLGVTI